jgi:hypothetical protein
LFRRLRLGLAVPAAVAGIALLLLMLGGTAPFRPLCAVLHVLNLFIVYLLWKRLGYGIRQIAGALVEAGRYLVGHEPSDPIAGRGLWYSTPSTTRQPSPSGRCG